MPGRYRYCRDPIFLAALALYILNRWLFKPLAQGHTHFFADYGNDLLCIPFWLPPWLFVYRKVGIRWHDRFPTRFEVLMHLIVWSLFFEWIAPALKGPFAWTVADPWDVVAYAVGAIVAGAYWGTWRHGRGRTSMAQPERREEAAT